MAELKAHIKKRINEQIKEQVSKKRATIWGQLKERLLMLEPLLKPKPLDKISLIKKESAKKSEQLERRRRLLLKKTLIHAGLETKPEVFSKWVFRTSIIINILIAVFLVQRYAAYFKFAGVVYVPILIITIWLATFVFVFFLLWLVLYLTFDFLSYRRKIGVEEVLPDFLLLTSANIRAGIPIDKALWYAVRPRFGVLAKEVEFVAKETMSGQDLEVALQRFSDKYDSLVLKNTINLLIEGINAGGEIGQLLHNISVSIQDNKRLRKEMAASISAYAIFITVSALVVAPIMFALSSQLLNVISDITGSINLPDVGMSTFAFATGGISINHDDFLKFAYINLFFTSLISAMIVSTIRKGGIKEGLKYIPTFILISLLVFFGALKAFGGVFGGII